MGWDADSDLRSCTLSCFRRTCCCTLVVFICIYTADLAQSPFFFLNCFVILTWNPSNFSSMLVLFSVLVMLYSYFCYAPTLVYFILSVAANTLFNSRYSAHDAVVLLVDDSVHFVHDDVKSNGNEQIHFRPWLGLGFGLGLGFAKRPRVCSIEIAFAATNFRRSHGGLRG